MNIGNLAMIFKLNAIEGVYPTSKDGEIILSSKNSCFEIDNFEQFYTVNGDPATAREKPLATSINSDLSRSPTLDLPLSYQPPSTSVYTSST